ncbi:MAG: ABC transporter ATP-binding protein [Rhodococcus sp. (in: high G+C Gram-positive bacteria)]|uniref:ABC transporter ATP-binding protein n=1 Tax=Rhodococcus sp. TaxID=1831 RepID=UPI002ADADACA|nr:ABC transporter ATP-binding protein [Rhodococcus sp. (in: high G+C Gram-positive bacteria)]
MIRKNAAVRLDNVRKVHGEGDCAVTALAGVTIEFGSGSFTAIMGPSGSGKSTLLHCAAGLDRPSSGTVTIAGTAFSELNEKARADMRRRHVGFVFQAFNLVGSLTAAQNVELPARFAGRRVPAGEVMAALAEVGLEDRASHRPAELSGGQQQRVALARALITRPDVLFADEPTGALDTRTSKDVLSSMRKLVDDQGQTTVMVTHDPSAAAYADRAIFLEDGRIVGSVALERGRSDNAAAIAARMAGLEA